MAFWHRRGEGDEEQPKRGLWTLCAVCHAGMIIPLGTYDLTTEQIVHGITAGQIVPLCAECLPSNGITEIEQFLSDVWGEGSNG